MSKSKLATTMIAATFIAAAAVQAATSVTATNATPDLTTVIEFYEDADNGSMGPRRRLTEPVEQPDRSSGQTFSISTPTSVTIDAITLKTSNAINFSGDASTHTFQIAILKDAVGGDGKADTQIGSTYSFDLTGLNVAAAGDYVTFHFDTPISNLVSGSYALDTYFGEEDDGNNFAFRRMQGTGTYEGGGQISKSSPSVFPTLNLNPSSTGNDFIFYVHGETLDTAPQGISVSSTVSTNFALEWYDSTAPNSSMTTRRRLTEPVEQPDRTLGQSFTIDTDTAVDITELTLHTWKNLDFSADPSNHTFKIAFMKDTNDDGKTDKLEGIYTYDLTGQNVFAWNTYITFHLGTPISNLVAGIYSFEMWWGEEDDANDAGFKRSSDGTDYYTRGGMLSVNPATDFPNASAWISPNNDLTFYIKGTEHESMPVAYTVSTNAPTIDATVLEHFQVSSDLAGWSATRIEEPTATNENNRVIGQTFTLDHGGEATLTAITARQHPSWSTDLRGTTNTHTFLVALSADTDGNGEGDTPLGTYAYDFTSEFIGTGEYFTFHLGDGISGVTAGVYQIEYYWGEVDPNNKGFNMERSKANNNYVDGGEVAKHRHDGSIFPVLEGVGLSPDKDLTFYVHGSVFVPSDPYDAWAAGYPGFTDTALDSDPEGDGLNNMMEYALNGDPTLNDAASVKPATHSDGSWFVHVHTERVGDASLSYAVELDQNADLPGASWATNGIEWVADSAVSGDYKSVTNRTDATDAQEFIRLQVEKN